MRTRTGSFRRCLRLMPLALLAAALAACGGGGGGGAVRPDPPPSSPPPVSPPPPPAEPTVPVVSTPNPAFSKHLTLTGANAAHDAGYNGAGIVVGVVDSGVNHEHPALSGRVGNLNYLGPPNDLSVDDVVGHGTAVAQIIAGQPFGQWPGGIAPQARIVSARIIGDTPPEDDGSGEGNEVGGSAGLGLAPVHQDLIDRGVRIMNNSWGGLYWTDPAATAGIAGDYRPFVAGNDGLVVFATGNDGRADPSDMAALPSQPGAQGAMPAADLERGWLAVAALDTDNPTQLAGYSNACGIAMRYCLAAPGTVVTTGTDDAPDDPAYWQWQGTSLAAPQVSGAAALVWQAFPYFDNDLVRQTLLGTANDLGEPGVDAVFGYGALNVGRAIHGPARFDWGDVTVDFDGITSTWSNPISGKGGLVKRGNGTLVLTQSSDYAGQTRIEGGTLRLAGNIDLVSDIRVGRAGALAGYGGVGNVWNDGNLQVDDVVFNVHGDYRQSADARLSLVLGNQLLVESTAYLDGELYVLGANPGYTDAGSVTVLAAQALSGEFSKLDAAPSVLLEGSLSYGDTNVVLNVTRLDVAAAALGMGGITAAVLGSAQRVEAAFEGIDAQRSAGVGGISSGFIAAAGHIQMAASEQAAKRSLQSLSGELHAAADAMTFDSIGANRRALASRFDELAARPALRGQWYQSLGQPGQDGFGLGRFQADGWMLGSDVRIGERGVAGFAFGQTVADASLGSDRGHDRQVQAQFYAGTLLGNAYALTQLGVGRYDRQLRRELLLGQRYDGVASDYAGDFLAANVELGYRFGSGPASFSPYLGADYVRLDRDGFVENGAYGFGLKSRAGHAERTQAVAGLRAQRDWTNARGLGFGLHGYAEWQQSLAEGGMLIEASFVGADSWSPLLGVAPARSGGLFGIGLDSWLSRSATLSFGYDQRFGSRSDERQWSAKLRYGF